MRKQAGGDEDRRSGTSLPMVSALTTMLLWRMPRMLIAAIAAMISVMTAARGRRSRSAGQ